MKPQIQVHPLNSDSNPNTQQTQPHRAPERLMPWAKAKRKWIPNFVSKRLFGATLAPTETEWQNISAALWQGDKAMDAVVDWMFEVGPREGKALFDQALHKGIKSIPNPPQALASFFATYDKDPQWLDRGLLNQGAEASHMFTDVAIFVLRDQALMGGYAYFNSFNQTLAMTGALSKNTSQRIAETGSWLVDVTDQGALLRYGKGFTTTMKVRLVHALVRRNVAQKPDWDADKWGIPVNQIDMLATYLAFGPVTLSGVRMYGVPITKKDSTAIMHMWRYIGWLLGLEEKWLAHTELDGLRKLYHTFLTHRLPDEKIQQLGMALQEEPWSRNLGEQLSPTQEKWKRRFLYHQHLSNSSLILGLKQRRQLGIPFYAAPWYPLGSAPFRFIKLSFYQLLGGKHKKQFALHVREKEIGKLEAFFGKKQRHIIEPQSGHPAHLG